MRYITLLIALLLLFSCEKEGATIDDNQINNCDSLIEFELSNQELFDIAYSNNKFYNGFYIEDLNGGSIYFENNVSVYRKMPRIKLCTDNYDTALNWSEISSNNSSYYRELISTNENEKYFEFVRERESNPNDIVLSRVFKCSYFDPSIEEKIDSIRVLGTFNKKDLNEENCLELIEFLYFIRSYNYHGVHYVFSQTCESGDYIYVFMYNVFLKHEGDWEVNDKIYLIKDTNTIHKESGKVTMYSTLLKKIDGLQN